MTEKYDTHRAALDRYGVDAQVLKCIEEMAELTVELLHFREGRGDIARICKEIADVRITGKQMALAFGEEMVDSEEEMQLERLRGRIAA